ncbi:MULTISPECIES: YrpD family protein [Paenibacillus]|uniref:YrpD family protein n=1 Tax=Paenibacillus TaxID=44249 RepID=UPI0022B8A81C|nr:YrpD family protein [Paenibacillus caseinilyticus]MCZ8519835.1 YrpD family protein [Paenibacillus caseinilyticus]
MKKKLAVLTVAASVVASFPVSLMAAEPAGAPQEVQVIPLTQNSSGAKVNEVVAKARAAGEEGLQKRAAAAKTERSAASADTASKSAVNYLLIEGNTHYLYEKNGVDEAEKVYVYESEAPAAASEARAKGAVAAAAVNLPDGIGGKAVVTKNGSYFNATVRTATAAQLTGAPSGATYIYGGFSGTGRKYDGTSTSYPVEADMGLQYSNSYGYVKWTPMLSFYNGVKSNGSFQSGYDKVQYKNGYKGGVDLNLTTYRNVNGNTRLSVSGTAECPDMACTSQTDTYLTSVVEVAGTNVSSVSKWKMLATIAGSETVTGKNYAQFKNVNVDGVTQTPTVEAEDYATVSISGSTATINVSR